MSEMRMRPDGQYVSPGSVFGNNTMQEWTERFDEAGIGSDFSKTNPDIAIGIVRALDSGKIVADQVPLLIKTAQNARPNVDDLIGRLKN